MIRPAKINDVKQIQKLINLFAEKKEMLPRSLNEIYENIQEFTVCEIRGKITGCCALHVTWDSLAEIKCLAVISHLHGKGIGRQLVEKSVKNARKLGVKKIFALTFKPSFFKSLGFRYTDKEKLPHKIWSECIHCPFFPDCKETALTKKI